MSIKIQKHRKVTYVFDQKQLNLNEFDKYIYRFFILHSKITPLSQTIHIYPILGDGFH